MVWSFSFYSLLTNALILRKVLGDKVWKKCEKCRKCEKVWKSAEAILPFSCCPLAFLWLLVLANSLESLVNYAFFKRSLFPKNLSYRESFSSLHVSPHFCNVFDLAFARDIWPSSCHARGCLLKARGPRTKSSEKCAVATRGSQTSLSHILSLCRASWNTCLGWSLTSGKRMSGASRPRLEHEVFCALPPLVSQLRTSREVWKYTWKSQTFFYQMSATDLKWGVVLPRFPCEILRARDERKRGTDQTEGRRDRETQTETAITTPQLIRGIAAM